MFDVQLKGNKHVDKVAGYYGWIVTVCITNLDEELHCIVNNWTVLGLDLIIKDKLPVSIPAFDDQSLNISLFSSYIYNSFHVYV